MYSYKSFGISLWPPTVLLNPNGEQEKASWTVEEAKRTPMEVTMTF